MFRVRKLPHMCQCPGMLAWSNIWELTRSSTWEVMIDWDA